MYLPEADSSDLKLLYLTAESFFVLVVLKFRVLIMESDNYLYQSQDWYCQKYNFELDQIVIFITIISEKFVISFFRGR